MVAQKGSDLLLKLDINGDGNFSTVAGMRSRRISFNAETIDTTDFNSFGRWRELLAGGGIQRAAISGSGIFKDAESDQQVRDVFFNGRIVSWLTIVPDFGSFEGPFQLTSLEYLGQYNGEVTFDLALESAGALTFEEAA